MERLQCRGIRDWAGIAPFIVDLQGRVPSGSPTGTDITNVYLAKDGTYLYCRIDLANGGPTPPSLYIKPSSAAKNIERKGWP